MNKRGFTLTELLAVIVVLAIIISIGMMSALGIMQRAKNKTLEEVKSNLIDAALTYCVEYRVDHPGSLTCNVSVNTLKSENYFVDDDGICKNDTITVTYGKKVNNNTNDFGVSNYSDDKVSDISNVCSY